MVNTAEIIDCRELKELTEPRPEEESSQAKVLEVGELRQKTHDTVEKKLSSPNLPQNYTDVTDSMLTACTRYDLTMYSKQAWQYRDWAAIIKFSKPIFETAENPDLGMLIPYALALRHTGNLKEALRIYEDFIDPRCRTIANRRNNTKCINTIKKLMKSGAARKETDGISYPGQYELASRTLIAECREIDVLISWAAQAMRQKDWSTMEVIQRRMKELEPNLAKAHLYLALSLERQGKLLEAKKELEEGRKHFSGSRLEKRFIDRLEFFDAQKEGTFPADFRQADDEMIARCQNREILIRWSRTAQAAGELSMAEKFQRRIMTLEPDNIGPYLILGDILEQCGRHNEALAFYEEEIAPRAFRGSMAAKTVARRIKRLRAKDPSLLKPHMEVAIFKEIKDSDFGSFLCALAGEGKKWKPSTGQGGFPWVEVPLTQRNFIVAAFGKLEKDPAVVIGLQQNAAFAMIFSSMQRGVSEGVLNLTQLERLLEIWRNASQQTLPKI